MASPLSTRQQGETASLAGLVLKALESFQIAGASPSNACDLLPPKNGRPLQPARL
jgi:hypothetical protein